MTTRQLVLVADRDSDTRRGMAWVLKEHGFDVVGVASGEAVLDQLPRSTPDLVVLDDSVLSSDPPGLLSRLKNDERWGDVPVLIVAGLPVDEAPSSPLAHGAADLIRKPFHIRELIARVHVQLRTLGALRAARDALRVAEADAYRARRDAEARRRVVDILRELTDDLSPRETYSILVRRVARALSLSHCSIVLARPGDTEGVCVASHDDPAFHDQPVQLGRYPEITAAVREGRVVLVEDVRASPLFAGVRGLWEREGIEIPVRSVLAVPFSLDRAPSGVFLLRRTAAARPLTRDDAEFAETLIKAAAAAIHRVQLVEATRADNARLEALAHTDALTMVMNRRALLARLTSELDRARRYNTLVTVLMIDIDDFKAVNDTFGHQVGDEVLTGVAQLLQHAVRSVDVVARYGGEEFVVVLPETGQEGAVVFAERIREKIEAHSFRIPGQALMLTVSIGVGSFPSQGVAGVDDLLSRADEALYRAKAAGRNRVRT